MARRNRLAAQLPIVFFTAAAVLSADRLLNTPAAVDVQPMLDASVSIRTVSHVTIDSLGDSVWGAGGGSGFLVDADTCEVWTNHHVVADAAMVEVYPRGHRSGPGIPARIFNSTPRGDLAILHLERCEGIAVARLGDSSAVRPGEDTYAVGNPLGNNPDSISRGIISHTRRTVEVGALAYLQTDAPINQGNSGGALFNRDGEVIGINTAIASRGMGGNIGIGYALPVNLARRLARELHAGPPSWGDAGLDGSLSGLRPDEAAIFGVPGGRAAVIVTREPDAGPAVGILRHHDVIHGIDGAPVTGVEAALRVLAERAPGEEITIDVMREGSALSLPLTLTDGWTAESTPGPDDYTGLLGMTLEMWSDRDGEEGQFATPVITRVQSMGPAHRARIASSQRAYAARGPFITEYRLDVKTITGVVLDGQYHAVQTPDALAGFAETAFRNGKSLLLEIQHWARENPVNPGTQLMLNNTAFYKVVPQPAHDTMLIANLDG